MEYALSIDKRFLSINDLTSMPAPKWAIEGLFEVNSLCMLAGPPGNYKSFLALDWILCMASGRNWHGRNTCPATVLYVLGEGKASLLKRIETWVHYNNLSQGDMDSLVSNFRTSFEVPQLASKASVDNMLAGLAAEGFTPQVIVIDTLARSFVGMDENSQQDTGLWIESADRLRQLGYTVIVLHHTNKNTEFGLKYRGSSAIMGAMDTAFTLAADSQAKDRMELRCTKQKDHDEFEPVSLQRLIVRPHPDDEGSIVLVPAIRVDERFTPEHQKVEDIIDGLLEDGSFESERQRAEKLSTMTGISYSAAQSRVNRRKRELDKIYEAKISQNRKQAVVLQGNVREA